MGSISYNNELFDFDDRVLAHLQVVIVQKLRRHESFLMSWTISQHQGNGRQSIWLDASIPIVFKFLGSRAIELNREWITQLGATANTNMGLAVTDEPELARHHEGFVRDAPLSSASPSRAR